MINQTAYDIMKSTLATLATTHTMDRATRKLCSDTLSIVQDCEGEQASYEMQVKHCWEKVGEKFKLDCIRSQHIGV